MVRAAITFGRVRVFKKFQAVAVSALAIVVAAILVAACGGSSGANPQEIAQAERHARQEKTEKEKERRLERKLNRIEAENRLAKKRRREKARRELKERQVAHVTPAPTPAPVESTEPSGTDCGDGVTAGPETSCGFALNVRAEYEAEIGEGSGSIEAWSEANEEWYPMFCTGAPHECEGAITATVYWP
jgi:hypothetical protein